MKITIHHDCDASGTADMTVIEGPYLRTQMIVVEGHRPGPSPMWVKVYDERGGRQTAFHMFAAVYSATLIL